MAPRPLIVATLLGSAIGVPYLASRAQLDGSAIFGSSPAAESGLGSQAISPSTTPPLAGPLVPQTNQYPAIEQVFRFDLSKPWIYRQWARKSTWPTEFGLYGVRVQLITGTGPSSLAGSLSYFFNAYDQVEHISFQGRTGDPRPLIAFLARTYEFQPAVGPTGEQLHQVKHGGRVKSELRVRADSVSTSATAHSSHLVELELARPNSQRFLPPRAPSLNLPASAEPILPSGSSASAASGAASPTEAANSKLKSAVDAYFEKARYATPQEQEHVLWKRWPN